MLHRLLLGLALIVAAGCSQTTRAQASPRNAASLDSARAAVLTPASFFYGPRAHHTSTVLADGRVLVAGGTNGASLLAECELYDPATGGFLPAAPLNFPRINHCAVLLGDGRVAVAGGFDGTHILDVVETYEPSTNRWDVSPVPLRVPRGQVRALPVTGLSPSAMLLVGGVTTSGAEVVPTNACELYVLDPNGDGDSVDAEVRFTAQPRFARTRHSVSLLPGPDELEGTADDCVLVYGGWGAQVAGTLPQTDGLVVLGEPEIYRVWEDRWYAVDANRWYPDSPQTRAAGQDQDFAGPRADHCAVGLSDGRVLLVGGDNGAPGVSGTEPGRPSGNSLVRRAEVFVPDYVELARSRILPSALLSVPRNAPSAAAVSQGRAVVAGGYDGGAGQVLDTVEVYQPGSGDETDSFELAGSMDAARIFHTATLLSQDTGGSPERVIFLGGSDARGVATASGLLFTAPATR